MYKLEVTLPGNTNEEDTVITISEDSSNPGLRVVFDVRTIFYQLAWYADIHIYNLDQVTTAKILTAQGALPSSQLPVKQGMTATLQAGYADGNFGTIWKGPVFQAAFTREDAVDFRISLYCLLWLDPLTRADVNQKFAAFTSQSLLISQLASKAFGSNTPVVFSSSFKAKNQSRASVAFGTVRKYIDNAAFENNAQWFFDGKQVSVAKFDDDIPVESEAKVFSPPPLPQSNQVGQVPSISAGVIVGTPEQTLLELLNKHSTECDFVHCWTLQYR
jgi:hypothetical protein